MTQAHPKRDGLASPERPGLWMVVRRSKLPGGYRVVQSRLTEGQARAAAVRYSRPHEAMSHKELMERRIEAMDGGV